MGHMAIFKFISQERKAQLSSFDSRWRLKLGLFMTTIMLSSLSIILFASAIPKWNANFFHSKGPSKGDWTDGMSIGPLLFNLLFTTLCILHFFSRQKPMPPKVCIVLFTLILLSLAPSLFLAGQGSLFRHWRAPAVRNQAGILNCNLLNIFSRDCEPILYTIGELQIGAITLGSLVWVTTFVVLLVAIFEARAQKMKKARLPLRLTLSISNMEKGYKKAHHHQRSRERHHSIRRSHRQHGTVRYYGRSSKEVEADTVPIYYVQEPPAAHRSQSRRSN